MKLKFEKIYSDQYGLEMELKNREHVLDTLYICKHFTNNEVEDSISYYLMKNMIGLYETFKTYNTPFQMIDIESVSDRVLVRVFGHPGDELFIEEFKKTLDPDVVEYVQARESYLKEIFYVASNGDLPKKMSLCNTFNPQNKYAVRIEQDFQDDFNLLKYMCE